MFRPRLDAKRFDMLFDDRVKFFHDDKVLDALRKAGDLFIAERIGKAEFEIRCVGIIFLEILVGNARCNEPELGASLFNPVERGFFRQLRKLHETFFNQNMFPDRRFEAPSRIWECRWQMAAARPGPAGPSPRFLSCAPRAWSCGKAPGCRIVRLLQRLP